MKRTSLFAAATMFLIPAFAFAGQKTTANFDLDESVTLAGTQLTPGVYKLSWEGNGPDVTVSFVEHGKTVATAPAKLVTHSNDETQAIETNSSTGKTPELHAVDLKNVTIRFESPVAAAGN